ncbi:MAG TPA: hypothetical protein DCR46_02200 [Cytophagales bacterium]|nr:hypothetical protein [Cytophagales bacterium]
MKKVSTICIIVSLSTLYLHAQQRAQYSQYMLNQYVLNPAVAGSTDYAQVVASYRNQWSGAFDNAAPTTYYLGGYTSLGRNSKKPHPYRNKHAGYHSIGGMVYNDQTGPTGSTGFLASYSYNERLSGTWRIALGASLGGLQYSLNSDKLTFAETESVPSRRQWVPDGNLGLWLNNKYFYFGGAISQVFQSKLDFEIPTLPNNPRSRTSKLSNHYFVTTGFRLEPTNDWEILPSIMFRFNRPAPVSLDLNAKVRYKNMVWAGTSYRNKDAVVFLFGFLINHQYEFGYSYDMTISKIQNYVGGSHEILLAYRIWTRAGIRNPSDFW